MNTTDKAYIYVIEMNKRVNRISPVIKYNKLHAADHFHKMDIVWFKFYDSYPFFF